MKKNQCILIKMLSHYYTYAKYIKSDVGIGAFYGIITDIVTFNNRILYICDCTDLFFSGYKINQLLIIGPYLDGELYLDEGLCGGIGLRYIYCVFSKKGERITKDKAIEFFKLTGDGMDTDETGLFRSSLFILKPDLPNTIKEKYFNKFLFKKVQYFNLYKDEIFSVDSNGELSVVDKNKIFGFVEIPSEFSGIIVKKISKYAFMDCTNLTNIVIPETVEIIDKSAFYYCINLENIVIPKSVEYVGEYAFQFCTSLKNVIFQNPNTSIGYHCFYYCTDLEEIKLPDNLSEIDSLFENCVKLKAIKIPETVISICMASFYGCKELRYIDLPKSVKGFGGLVFAECTNLERVTLSDCFEFFNLSSFMNCPSLSEIYLPASVKKIGNCEIIDNLELKIDENNQFIKIYNGNLYSRDMTVFIFCLKNMAEIIIDDNTKIIADGAFSGCTLLNKLIIPESVEYIGVGAFNHCMNLESVLIPYSVKTIEFHSFDCTNLKYIKYNGTKEQWAKINKKKNWHGKILATEIHCIDGDIPLD